MNQPTVDARPPQVGEQHDFAVTLTLQQGYQFQAQFEDTVVPPLVVDESPPLGRGLGPSPTRVLATAIGHCLSSSLLFCLRKARIEPKELRTTVHGTLVRNERGRLRIGGLQVKLDPVVAPEDRDRMGRCLELFQDFCLVTESVRKTLRDQAGGALFLLIAVSPHFDRPELDALRARIGRDHPGAAVHLDPLSENAVRDLSRWALPRYTDAELDRVTRRCWWTPPASRCWPLNCSTRSPLDWTWPAHRGRGHAP